MTSVGHKYEFGERPRVLGGCGTLYASLRCYPHESQRPSLIPREQSERGPRESRIVGIRLFADEDVASSNGMQALFFSPLA